MVADTSTKEINREESVGRVIVGMILVASFISAKHVIRSLKGTQIPCLADSSKQLL